ncbi:MAG: thioredoxin domain-containing protein [Thermoplasmata archaeon]
MVDKENMKGGSDMEEKETSITIKKSTLWKVGTFVFLGLFIISLFTGGFNGILSGWSSTGKVIANPTANPTPNLPSNGDIQVKVAADDPVLGNKNAEITIVEFSDFQCPFCARVQTGALAEFKNSNYFKKGQVNLVYKHFPLNSIHPQAQKAAEAAECANRQGKFWEYHDKLFENQNALDIASLKQYATQVGLDTAKFNKCLDNGEATAEVNKETSEATAAGGRGTPYFVLVNKDGETQAISGAVPWANFEAAIKALK